jgi:hypothetical protein
MGYLQELSAALPRHFGRGSSPTLAKQCLANSSGFPPSATAHTTQRKGDCVMLKILFGDTAGAVYHPPTYFDNRYEDEWITDPLSVQMIKDIDRSEVVGAHLIQSPVLGPIPVKDISGGVKTLILMAFDQSGKIFNASACGDNCAKWIVTLGKEKDLTINLHHADVKS